MHAKFILIISILFIISLPYCPNNEDTTYHAYHNKCISDTSKQNVCKLYAFWEIILDTIWKQRQNQPCYYDTVGVSGDVQHANISSVHFIGQCYLLLSVTSGINRVIPLASLYMLFILHKFNLIIEILMDNLSRKLVYCCQQTAKFMRCHIP